MADLQAYAKAHKMKSPNRKEDIINEIISTKEARAAPPVVNPDMEKDDVNKMLRMDMYALCNVLSSAC